MTGLESPPEKPPILWARLAVNHTKKVLIISLVTPVLLGAIVFFFRLLSFAPPGGGRDFLVVNDERTELNDAFAESRKVYEFGSNQGFQTERDITREFTLLLRNTAPGGSPGKYKPADVDIEKEGTNLFTREGLAYLKSVEDSVLATKDFEKYCYRDLSLDCAGVPRKCALPYSITNHPLLYGETNGKSPLPCGRKEGAEPVSEEEFEKLKSSLTNGTGQVDPTFALFMGLDVNTNVETQILRSFIQFGSPIANTSEAATDAEKDAEFEKWASDTIEKVEEMSTSSFYIFVNNFSLFGSRFTPVVFRDLMFSLAAVVVVYIVVRIHTTSGFLANITILQILYSFPFTFFVYRIIFQVNYFATLQVLTIFLILGIGADDVFVFTDAWKQAPVLIGTDVTLEERMSYAYKRAVKAMSVTTLTTAVAFYATAASPIMSISTFGIFTGTLVMLQFVLVITAFPSALIIWHRFWRHRSILNCFRAPKPESEVEETVENPSDSAAPSKFCGIFPKKKKRSESEYRPIERFFNGFWTNLTHKIRYPLISLGFLIIGACIWLSTRLETPRETEKFLPDDFPLQQASILGREAFPSFDDSNNLVVNVVWGVEGIDRKGISRYNTEDAGVPILDDMFSLKTAAAQKRVLDACSFFADPSLDLVTNESSITEKQTCWIADFKNFRTNVLGKTEDFETYATEAELAKAVLEFGNYTSPTGQRPYFQYLRNEYIGFNEARDEVLFTYISFVTPLKDGEPYSVVWPEYESWQEALKKFKEGTDESGVENPFATSNQWPTAITQRALVDNMFLGIGIVFAVSLVSLSLSTGNVIVSILALLSIGGILTSVLGLMYLLGWTLGVIESIGVVLSIGFSFDYVAHVANAYTESNKGDTRLERTRTALTDLGISILFGALSTVAAGSMLFFAVVIFFTKIGVITVATVTIALLWALLFLPALLHTFGPTGQTGELMWLVRKVWPGRK